LLHLRLAPVLVGAVFAHLETCRIEVVNLLSFEWSHSAKIAQAAMGRLRRNG